MTEVRGGRRCEKKRPTAALSSSVARWDHAQRNRQIGARPRICYSEPQHPTARSALVSVRVRFYSVHRESDSLISRSCRYSCQTCRASAFNLPFLKHNYAASLLSERAAGASSVGSRIERIGGVAHHRSVIAADGKSAGLAFDE